MLETHSRVCALQYEVSTVRRHPVCRPSAWRVRYSRMPHACQAYPQSVLAPKLRSVERMLTLGAGICARVAGYRNSRRRRGRGCITTCNQGARHHCTTQLAPQSFTVAVRVENRAIQQRNLTSPSNMAIPSACVLSYPAARVPSHVALLMKHDE